MVNRVVATGRWIKGAERLMVFSIVAQRVRRTPFCASPQTKCRSNLNPAILRQIVATTLFYPAAGLDSGFAAHMKMCFFSVTKIAP